jgi:hypothetical protein
VNFIGIDVQLRRGLAVAVMDDRARVWRTAWLSPGQAQDVAAELAQRYPGATVGIDAPRQPLMQPRAHYWSRDGWRAARPGDRGQGRHCEVVIAALGREFSQGRGCAVGGGDGLGRIVLPRPLQTASGPEGVLVWPDREVRIMHIMLKEDCTGKPLVKAVAQRHLSTVLMPLIIQFVPAGIATLRPNRRSALR